MLSYNEIRCEKKKKINRYVSRLLIFVRVIDFRALLARSVV